MRTFRNHGITSDHRQRASRAPGSMKWLPWVTTIAYRLSMRPGACAAQAPAGLGRPTPADRAMLRHESHRPLVIDAPSSFSRGQPRLPSLCCPTQTRRLGDGAQRGLCEVPGGGNWGPGSLHPSTPSSLLSRTVPNRARPVPDRRGRVPAYSFTSDFSGHGRPRR